MTLEELNEILNLFGLNMSAYVNDVYFNDMDANTDLDVFYYNEEDEFMDRTIRTHSKKSLLNGHRFYAEGLINDFTLSIKYNAQEDKYNLLYICKSNRRYEEDPEGVRLNLLFLDKNKKYKVKDLGKMTLELFDNDPLYGIDYNSNDDKMDIKHLFIQNTRGKDKSKVLFDEYNYFNDSEATTYYVIYNDGIVDYQEDCNTTDFNYVYNSNPIIKKLLDLYGTKLVDKEIIDPDKCFRLNPMLPTAFSAKERAEIRRKEAEILKNKNQ